MRVMRCTIIFLAFASFYLEHSEAQEDVVLNATSCRKFVQNTKFRPERLYNVEWEIFYYWHPGDMLTWYRATFSKPTKADLRPFIMNSGKDELNISTADLLMDTTNKFRIIFAKTPISGLYLTTSALFFQDTQLRIITTTVPVKVDPKEPMSLSKMFALKFMEPGLLGIVNCRSRIAFAFAPVGRIPAPLNMKAVAQRLGFRSPYGKEIQRH